MFNKNFSSKPKDVKTLLFLAEHYKQLLGIIY